MVTTPAPATRHGPSGSRISAVCSSSPTSVAERGSRSIERSRRWSAAVPWYGNTASSRTTPSPTVYAPPRGSTIGSHSTVAPAPDAASTDPFRYPATIASNRAESLSAERRCSGDPSATYTNPASLTPLTLARSSASARRRTDRPRTDAPSPEKYSVARATTRSGCSNAAAVGSTTTSSPARASSSAPKSRQPSRHSPPPTSASVPDACLGLMAPGAYLRVTCPFCTKGARFSSPRGSHRDGQARRNRRLRDHGLRHRRGRGQGRLRGQPAEPPAEHGGPDDGGTREVAREAGRQGQARRRRARHRPRTRARPDRPRRALLVRARG